MLTLEKKSWDLNKSEPEEYVKKWILKLLDKKGWSEVLVETEFINTGALTRDSELPQVVRTGSSYLLCLLVKSRFMVIYDK